MAVTTTTQVLYDGPLRAKVQVTGSSDGSGEVSLATLVDASALGRSASGLPCTSVQVSRINANVKPQGSVQLYWGALVPALFANLSGTQARFDYTNITGITAPADTVGPTGDIVYSTTGMTAGSTFTLELELKKKFN